MIDPENQLAFSVAENPGVYALLIGSGVSRSAEIPTGWEVTLDLARRLAVAEGVDNQADWAAWYRERFAEEPSYSSILDKLTLTPAERRSILHNYIAASSADLEAGRRIPSIAHKAIACLVRDEFLKVIITTNFDRLLETAIRDIGIEPTIIKSVDDLNGAVPIIHSQCYVLKIHGDYLDNRILNTDRELESYPQEFDRLLDRIFDEYGLIISGWSGDWDFALRAAIMRAPSRRYPTYWTARGEPSEQANEIIRQRAARCIRISSADSFFKKLQLSVETLHRERRTSPQQIELLLAGVRRFIVRNEYRIELNDLICENLIDLQAKINSKELSADVPVLSEDFVRQRWVTLEALAEPLARAMGLLGRWGDGKDFDLAKDCLLALLTQPPQSGYPQLVGLRSYPAYLCFLTYALGLAKAARFDVLFRWFHLDLSNSQRARANAATSLFMCFWDEIENNKLWEVRDSKYVRRKTPWSDYLVDHIVPWSSDYGLTEMQALDNYNILEFLGASAALTGNSEISQGPLNEPTWMPFGRLVWADQDRQSTITRLETPDMHRSIMKAGFSAGSKAHWDGVKANFALLSRRIP